MNNMIPTFKQFAFIFFFFTFINTVAFCQNTDLQLAEQYFSEKDFEKAISLYAKLSKDDAVLPTIYKNYLAALYAIDDMKAIEKLIKRAIKLQPQNAAYHWDYTNFLRKTNKKDADKYWDSFIEQIKNNEGAILKTADLLIASKEYEQAEKLYKIGQKYTSGRYDYLLAELYYISGNKQKSIIEYMEIINNDESQLSTVQDVMQIKFTSDDEFKILEPIMIDYVQKYPWKIGFAEMLTWLYLQRQDYLKAFIQAKALDKRTKQEGNKIYSVGTLAMGNERYEEAEIIFKFLIENYADKPIYTVARKSYIKCKEEIVKKTYPVDMQKITELVNEYQQIIENNGIKPHTVDAVRSVAMLYATYLNDIPKAINLLQAIIETRYFPSSTIAEAKLDLADVYLLKGEPWEATLLYSQVEKSEKESTLAHIAKLKNAKLHYYKGDFELAKAHLDILKLATSREIANDALELSVFIQENLGLDSSETALRLYATTELLIFQNKYEEALKEYKKIKDMYPNHSLIDNILWQEAKIYNILGKTDSAIARLEDILAHHGDDVLADDAHFMLGKIYEEKLHDKSKAMEMYKNQLVKFPGSIYNQEARRRFRLLRGDTLN
ncbi:MAG: tetratricopeptide repeat protein [Cytophagales bacterium]|nr:tetratricopeptide repeat protein [Cytophagales bacterium]MDW8384031.1 tetratricopeptide repeat protein [Flammeovirgaceae bacterium]